MTYSRHEKFCTAAAVMAASFVAGMGACTPATVDQPIGAAGSSASTGGANPSTSGGSTGTGNSGGALGSSGATQTGGGAAGSDTVGVGGSSAPSGGAAPTDGGTGGAVAAAGGSGTTGTAGTGGAGGAASGPIGCGWVKAASGLWTMNPPAADKQVLYNGTDKGLNQWHRLNMPNTPAQWQVLPDGSMEVVPQPTPTNIQSNAKFDDVCLHVEYRNDDFAPSEPDVQKHGNSGVYLKSAYEMQVLDTSNLGILIDGCGAVYKVSPPMVVACIMHPAWNVYEIEFKGSLWNAAGTTKTQNAVFVQVTLNGKLVQQNVSLNPAGGFTEAGIPDVAGPQPVALQDHRETVDYRNIWAAVPHY